MTISILEEFAQEKGSKLTPHPIYVKLDSKIRRSNNGLVLAYITREVDGSCWNECPWVFDNNNYSIKYVIYISKWFYKAFIDKMDILKKIICHELAHIKYTGHSDDFIRLAREIGAEDFSCESTSLLKITNRLSIWVLTICGFGYMIRRDFPEDVNDNDRKRCIS
jgi:hypothetical protein